MLPQQSLGSAMYHLTQARYGTALQMDSLWNRWFRRQRPHAHAPELQLPGFGRAYRDRVTGVME